MDKLIIGCGYLGRRVAELWRAQGQRVTATTRRQENLAGGTDGTIICDVLDAQSLEGLPQAETVLYAVGLDRSAGASMRSVYVDGLANVLERLPAPGKFIYVSSSSVYGQTGGEWVDEEAPTLPLEESGQIVLAAENVLRAKLPTAVVLRFAGIYGPGRLLRQKTVHDGAPIVGAGDRWLNLIHVEDGARVVLAAEQRAVPGRFYNVCDDQPVQRQVFFTALAKELGAPVPRFVPPPPGTPLPPHERANRRLRNRRLHEELQCTLRHPGYEEGISASVLRVS